MAVNYKIDSIRSGHSESDRHAAWYAGRPWAANYPDFMRRDIDIAPDATILALMRGACAEYADRVAFELGSERLTYGEWLERSDALARFFRGSEI